MVLPATTRNSSQISPELSSSHALLSPEQHSNLANERIFSSILHDSAREAMRSALGDTILGLLSGQKMLEDPGDAHEFTQRLLPVFGASGAKTLQFIVAKELYRQLNLPFNPEGSFDYETFIGNAKTEFLARRTPHV